MGFVYSGAVLNEPHKLREYISLIIPEGWSVKCHHMTTNLGRLDQGPAAHLEGQRVLLEIDAVALDLDLQVMAARVKSGPPSVNTTPHVTIAVGPRGKAKDSNLLTEWIEITPLELEAVVQTVEM